MTKLFRSLVLVLVLVASVIGAPAMAQAPQQSAPEKVLIEFDATKLALVVKAIGNGLVKNEADPLLQYIQAQINAQIAQWQKDHAPAEKAPKK